MKTKMKSKRGKAIIGIAMAAIMIASLMALVPMVSADYGAHPGTFATNLTTIIKGTDEVDLSAFLPANVTSIALKGAEGTDIEGETVDISDISSFEVLDSWKEGLYDVVQAPPKQVFVKEPTITTKIYLSDKTEITDGSIVEGQPFYVKVTTNFGYILGSDPDPAKINLKVINPDGREITVDQSTPTPKLFIRDTVNKEKPRYPSEIATDYYCLKDAGEYKFTAKTPAPGIKMNSFLEIAATTVTLTVVTEVISIDVEEIEVAEGEDVLITGSGKSKTWYSLEIDAGGGVFKTGVKNVLVGEQVDTTDRKPVEATGHFIGTYANNFAAVKTNAAGEFKATIDTEGVDTGSYTVYVEKGKDDEDKVEYKIVELKVTLETDKATYVIGEDVIISGASPAGDKIIIAIDEVVVKEETIKADDTYEYKWTETKAKIPGSYKIEVWNYPVTWDILGSDYKAINKSADATITIYLSEPGMTAELSRTKVALGDEFRVKGEAPGADNVLVLAIASKGTGGTAIDTGAKSDVLYKNIYRSTVSVSAIDYTFDKKIDVNDDADGGEYLIVALCTGKDEKFGNGEKIGEFLDSEIKGGVVEKYALKTASKTKDQMLDILKDATVDVAGSDDLLWVGKVKCEEGKVTLGPITDVAAGEPLVVSGTTNRKDDHPIIITVVGPVEIPAKTASVEGGAFNVTFDTTGATEGTYTVTADDGDDHTDEATVEIGAAVPPTPTPPVETPTPPVVTPTVPPVVTPTPPVETPTPTPEPPGFEAVFAIAGMLSIAYLVLRRRK